MGIIAHALRSYEAHNMHFLIFVAGLGKPKGFVGFVTKVHIAVKRDKKHHKQPQNSIATTSFSFTRASSSERYPITT